MNSNNNYHSHLTARKHTFYVNFYVFEDGLACWFQMTVFVVVVFILIVLIVFGWLAVEMIVYGLLYIIVFHFHCHFLVHKKWRRWIISLCCYQIRNWLDTINMTFFFCSPLFFTFTKLNPNILYTDSICTPHIISFALICDKMFRQHGHSNTSTWYQGVLISSQFHFYGTLNFQYFDIISVFVCMSHWDS